METLTFESKQCCVSWLSQSHCHIFGCRAHEWFAYSVLDIAYSRSEGQGSTVGSGSWDRQRVMMLMVSHACALVVFSLCPLQITEFDSFVQAENFLLVYPVLTLGLDTGEGGSRMITHRSKHSKGRGSDAENTQIGHPDREPMITTCYARRIPLLQL
jgi:hypothetical protein